MREICASFQASPLVLTNLEVTIKFIKIIYIYFLSVKYLLLW